MKLIHIVSVAAVALAASAFAQSNDDHSAHHSTAAAAPAAGRPSTDGEVRKVDREQGKITLKHGPIENLDMPAMTMVFKVPDPKMLENVKEGDKVKFSAERVDGALTLTTIEPQK